MAFLNKGRSKLTTKPAGKITKTKTPVKTLVVELQFNQL
jgi:hypothetical protein